jgi:hypothetical protein
VIFMRYAALTGINPSVIAEIKMGRPRTLELTSAHNIITLSEVEPDSLIFMTSTDMEDLTPGDAGILVHVMNMQILSITKRGNAHLPASRYASRAVPLSKWWRQAVWARRPS